MTIHEATQTEIYRPPSLVPVALAATSNSSRLPSQAMTSAGSSAYIDRIHAHALVTPYSMGPKIALDLKRWLQLQVEYSKALAFECI